MIKVYMLIILLNNEPIQDRFSPTLFMNKADCESTAYQVQHKTIKNVKSFCKPILIKSEDIRIDIWH
tara:strand:- start:272 stop:472 length:201 start_codon:yes stop_codon:yes gene_type:complete